MTNGQAFAALIAIKLANPEHAEAAESLMKYISDLVYVAGLASENLNMAARRLTDDQIIQHNAHVAASKLDALCPAAAGDGDY